MDLNARLCIELDGSVTAELLVVGWRASKRANMVVWSQNFATFVTADHDMVCARAALEEQVKKVQDILGESLKIRTYKVAKEYKEIFEKNEELLEGL